MSSRTFLIFWLTTFLGAFLLFLIQPMIAKIILPWFGGAAAVWTACMMFFQIMLVLGYTYAHLSNRLLSRRHAYYLHAGLLTAACCCLPIIPNQSLQPTSAANVNLAVSMTLLLTVGLPYFVLASNSTLVQMWHQSAGAENHNSTGGENELASKPPSHRTPPVDRSTYRLYAVSNLGSMLALLTYPFLIEPFATLTGQAWLWSVAFIGFAILSLVAAWPANRATPEILQTVTNAISPPQVAIWLALSSTASVVLLATTNLMCQEIASAPFLWILPLAAYLATFIICFQNPRLYHRGVFIALLCVFVVLGIAVVQAHIYLSILIQIAILTGVCFFVAMVCHGELERAKPPANRLTTFNLTLSIGGAAGGIFTALIAPRIFDGFYEFQLSILAALAIVLYQIYQSPVTASPWNLTIKITATAGIGLAAAITLASYMLQTNDQFQTDIVMRSRNQYGVMMVKQNQTYRRFVSGNVDHGGQFLDPQKSLQPSGYYTPNSGVGIAFERIRERRAETPSINVNASSTPSPAPPSPAPLSPVESKDVPLDVAVIGMGIGAMLSWCQPADQFTLYELNPAVGDIATQYFTYLDHFANQTRVLIGDGRLLLRNDVHDGRSRKFDLIFVDAFSSDAIPQHLLTSQCLDEYLDHLNDDGILVFHITNRFVDLRPVIATLAEEKNLAAYVRENRNTPTDRGTRWVLLSRHQSMFDAAWLEELKSNWPPNMPTIQWTDDFAPLAPVTIWNTGVDVQALRWSQQKIDSQHDSQTHKSPSNKSPSNKSPSNESVESNTGAETSRETINASQPHRQSPFIINGSYDQ